MMNTRFFDMVKNRDETWFRDKKNPDVGLTIA